METETKLLTGQDAAKIIGVSPNVISRLANAGDIKSEQCGKRRVFTSQDIDEYLSNNNLFRAPQDHERKSKDIPSIIGLSFFSGAGGLDLGMENEGIPSLLYCENNREARMTLDANRPDAALLGDINSVTAEQIRYMARIPQDREVDVMFGGPPCQAFSTAGARRAFDDKRGNIFLRYLDLAEEIQPKYLIIENVRGLLSTPFPINRGGEPIHGGAMKTILSRLKKMGYGVSFNLYNAANFGAAQIRERVILIAKRDGTKAPWLSPTHSCAGSPWNLPDWVTFAQATEQIEGKKQHHTEFPEKRLRYFKMLTEGQCWTSLPKNLQEEAMGKAYKLGGGRTGFYRRIDSKKPSPTLVTSPTMPATDLCHPFEDRPLSVEEYKAIQGFPETWNIAGSITDIYRQVGNAVPIKLGEAVARTILADMQEETLEQPDPNFPYSRYHNTNDLTWSE